MSKLSRMTKDNWMLSNKVAEAETLSYFRDWSEDDVYGPSYYVDVMIEAGACCEYDNGTDEEAEVEFTTMDEFIFVIITDFKGIKHPYVIHTEEYSEAHKQELEEVAA